MTGVGQVGDTIYVIGTDLRDSVFIRKVYGGGQPWIKVVSRLGWGSSHGGWGWGSGGWFGWGSEVGFDADYFDPSGVDEIEIHLFDGRDKALLRSWGHGAIDVSASVFGGAGRDIIGTARGDDFVDGGDDHDFIATRSGDDTVIDMDGDNRIWLGSGDDTAHAGDGDDWIFGNSGDDWISAGDGDNKVWGGSGDDTVISGAGDDWLGGEDGNDLLIAGAGRDDLDGGDGDDILYGGSGKDELWGVDGRDLIIGGDGKDKLRGGRDSDLIVTGIIANDDVDSLNAALNYWLADDVDAALAELGLLHDGDDGDKDKAWGNQGVDTLIGGDNDKLKQ